MNTKIKLNIIVFESTKTNKSISNYEQYNEISLWEALLVLLFWCVGLCKCKFSNSTIVKLRCVAFVLL